MGTLGEVGLAISIVAGIGLALMFSIPSQLPRVAHVPPERLRTIPQPAVNDYAGSVASVVYAGHPKVRQAVRRALKAVRGVAKHVYAGVRRHRVVRPSLWRNRRGPVWPMASFTMADYRPRHDGTQEMMACV